MSEEPLSYYQRNKAKCLAQAKAYQQKHRDEYREYHRTYYQMNRDELLRRGKVRKQKRVKHPRQPKQCIVKKADPLPIVITPITELPPWTLVIDKKEVTVSFD